MEKVYTVIGERGNWSGPYTHELPSMEAALEAIRKEDFPLLVNIGSAGVEMHGSRVSFTVSEPHCYCIVEHDPRRQTAPHTYVGGVTFGGRVYELDSGKVGDYGCAKRGFSDDVPPAWRRFRDAVQEANKGLSNVAGTYRKALKTFE